MQEIKHGIEKVCPHMAPGRRSIYDSGQLVGTKIGSRVFKKTDDIQ